MFKKTLEEVFFINSNEEPGAAIIITIIITIIIIISYLSEHGGLVGLLIFVSLPRRSLHNLLLVLFMFAICTFQLKSRLISRLIIKISQVAGSAQITDQ